MDDRRYEYVVRTPTRSRALCRTGLHSTQVTLTILLHSADSLVRTTSKKKGGALMRRYVPFALAIIALVSIWPCDRLEAAPILEDPLRGLDRTGFGIDFHADVLGIYDSSLDRLRITSLRENAEYRGPGTSLLFTSFFELTAGVDEFGQVTNGGMMRWEGDFGSGRELLATGKLTRSRLRYDQPESRCQREPECVQSDALAHGHRIPRHACARNG